MRGAQISFLFESTVQKNRDEPGSTEPETGAQTDPHNPGVDVTSTVRIVPPEFSVASVLMLIYFTSKLRNHFSPNPRSMPAWAARPTELSRLTEVAPRAPSRLSLELSE